jgi:hypothetical protein
MIVESPEPGKVVQEAPVAHHHDFVAIRRFTP